MSDVFKVFGIIEDIVFANETNGYTVCELRSEKGLITVVGHMPFVNIGESLKITGRWVSHPDYGEQLKVEMYEKILPQAAEEIEKYLSSGIIKGIGPVLANKIVERFGEATLDIIQTRPGLLSEIKGISFDKAMKIGQAFREQEELGAIVVFLQDFGISPAYAARVYKALGHRAIEEIKNNPYMLADEEFGLGFKIADRIAMRLGVDPTSKYRISSCIKFVLSQAAARGHTYIPFDRLKESVLRQLDIEINADSDELYKMDDALISLAMNKEIYIERDGSASRVYLAPFFQSEIGISGKIVELLCVDFSHDFQDIDGLIGIIEDKEGITLAGMQKTAIRESFRNGVLVITGGPGTGKTTIIKCIMEIFQGKGYEVVLAAPTGRAAKRMTEATGFEAKTIHRLLEIGYMEENTEPVFLKNESNPLDADAVIIDEVSMVDVLLMNHLLKAITRGTRLILVGDVNQLPSVGPGNVLKDIISSGLVKTVKLTEIFRQAEESMIIVNAHRINRGEKPELNIQGKDFFFISRKSSQSIVETIKWLCAEKIPNVYGLDPLRQIQVLTPVKKGAAGVLNLNIELQKVLNPGEDQKTEKQFGHFVFREGDKVMQIKNNYDLKWSKAYPGFAEGRGVFNGDIGVILRIDYGGQKLKVAFEDDKIVEYDFSILDEIEPAFAITIHKSQGSEFPAVVMPVFPGPEVLMTRNLLYTAVTRARDLVVLVGFEESLYKMIDNEREMLRFSGLADKIRRFSMNKAFNKHSISGDKWWNINEWWNAYE